jgi:ferredoxin
MKVEVDFGLCESNGICMGLVPEVFDLQDDDVLIMLKSEVGCEEEDAVREAVRQCPRQAISLYGPPCDASQ